MQANSFDILLANNKPSVSLIRVACALPTYGTFTHLCLEDRGGRFFNPTRHRPLKKAHESNHYQKTGEKQRNYRRNFSVGNLFRQK
jgi:hypothetical protein